MRLKFLKTILLLGVVASLTGCLKKEDTNVDPDAELTENANITIENVLNAKPLVQSGTFIGPGTRPIILPGQSASVSFFAGKNQTLTFATMYGWSNDLFFAPENPGIALYKEDGSPISGDLSSQIRIWDNGSRINEKPGRDVVHPGIAEPSAKTISAINGTDEYGNSYLPASQLMNVSLQYNGDSNFTLTITNTSGGTPNETPFSPGVWAISYVAGGNPLLPDPIYSAGQETRNGLTNIAEAGDNSIMRDYLSSQTGIFTPLSPVLVVVYSGTENPFYKVGENDRGEGLKELAQMGDADILASALMKKTGIKNVYVLREASTRILLPSINGLEGGKVSQELTVSSGDRIAIATMYGFSNDWFFATKDNGVDAMKKGDISSMLALFDNGTAVDQFPGASSTQFNLDGSTIAESLPISPVPNPNAFTTLPPINEILKVTLN